jgi:DNA polymerase
MHPRQAIVWHLHRAIDAYGDDLPLPRAHALAVAAPAAPPTTAGDQPAGDQPETLDALRESIRDCARCKLCRGRTQVVFGEGAPDARVMFVGEAPGAREDEQGRPFVGPAGQLLTRIIENAMGLARAHTYIANVNKCRPPGNRNPEPDEIAACLPFLRRQIELIRPAVIVALGRVAAHNLLGTTRPMRDLRGANLSYAGIPVVVTWHPAYLLRTPSAKRETWDDIKRVNRLLGRPETPGATGAPR